MSHIFLSACVLVFHPQDPLPSDQSGIHSHPLSALLGHLVFNWLLSLHLFSLAYDMYIG